MIQDTIIEGNKVVCFDCGVKYLTEKQKQQGGNAVTFHQGICCQCGMEKSVTSVRHYNNLKSQEQVTQ